MKRTLVLAFVLLALPALAQNISGGGGVSQLVAGSNISLSPTSGRGIVTVTASGSLSTGFNNISSGTNTSAAMLVGSGASLGYTGTGTVNANELGGATLLGGTFVDTDYCTYAASGTLLNCNNAFGTNVAPALGNPLNGNSGLVGDLTPISNNCVVGNGTTWTSAVCPGGGGGGTGFGVDGGTASVTLTASCVLGTTAACSSHSIRLVKIGTLSGPVTFTLDAIANVSADTCVRFEDAGSNVGATNTVTLAANAADSINGGSAGGSTSAFTTAGLGIAFCVTATHNWNIFTGATIASSSAPTNQFANGVTQNGLSYAQPSIANLSGWGSNVEGAAATTLSASGGLTSTIASGTAALGTGAITSATCATVVTVTATNVATTDTVLASFNGDPTAVTGYIPSTSGMLTIIGYPTAGNVNFKVCNNTSASVTPGAITLNWRVVR